MIRRSPSVAVLLGAFALVAELMPTNIARAEGESPPLVQRVELDGTRIRVQKADGSWATDQELIGATLVAADDHGIRESFRIDAIETLATEAAGALQLYTFSVQDAETGAWTNFCEPDRSGMQKGFPLSGYWDERGNHVRAAGDFSITCTSGTIGKCVLLGYLPWATTANGESLWRFHQTCVRMMRADYCGDGEPHTRDGTLVEIWDRASIQVDSATPELTFEAAWNENGAVCLRRTRIPQLATLEQVLAECPERLAGRTGPEQCREGFVEPSVLILNRSPGP